MENRLKGAGQKVHMLENASQPALEELLQVLQLQQKPSVKRLDPQPALLICSRVIKMKTSFKCVQE